MMAKGDAAGGVEDLYRGWFGDSLATHVLRIVGGSVLDNPSPVSMDALIDGASSSGAYCLYNMGLSTAGGGAAHMVASCMSHGTFGLGVNRHFYFFGPNMGEYRIGTDDMKPFLRGVMDAYESTFLGVNYFDQFQVERG